MRTRATLAFVSFFLLLCSYFILRPVRDEMGVQSGAGKLQWLFTGTFVATLIAVPIFGAVVARVQRRLLLPVVYGFFITNLIAFHFAMRSGPVSLATAATFFIWLSVFNLFVVSLFWSTASDVFTTEESHRLYGFIAAGGTAGALTGPALTAVLARNTSTANLIAISTVLFTLATIAATMLARTAGNHEGREIRIGGGLLAGIRLTLQSPTLAGIALLVICYTTVSTFLYFEQAEIVRRTISDSGERTAFFATIDLFVNGVALFVQLTLTSFVVRRFGVRTALVIIPLLLLAGFFLIAVWPVPVMVAAVQIAHRAGDFSLGKPSREMIYTTVDAESRYKAKNFIDTAVYRGNDAVAGWITAVIRTGGLGALVAAGAAVALVWSITGYRIGRRHDERRIESVVEPS